MYGMGDLQAAKELQNSFSKTKPPRSRNNKSGGARNKDSYQAPTYRQPDHANQPYLGRENQGSYPRPSPVNLPEVFRQDMHARRDDYIPREFEANQQKSHGNCEQGAHGPPSRRSRNPTFRPPRAWQGQLVTSKSEDAASFWSPPSNQTLYSEASPSMPVSIAQETAPTINPPMQNGHVPDNFQISSAVPSSKTEEIVQEEEDLIDFSEPSPRDGGPIPDNHGPIDGSMSNSIPNQYNIGYSPQQQAPPTANFSQEFPKPCANTATHGGPFSHVSIGKSNEETAEDIQMGGMNTTPLPPSGAGLSGSSWNPQKSQSHQAYADIPVVRDAVPSRRPPSSRTGPIVTSGVSRGLGLASSRWCDAADPDEEL
ncbi:hypothetical protein F4810DRAFT_675062 [Camillea tinctor]|nr:hypothetical protein F4810DRAFT_675062 [Camillea tinctor]